jgi:lipopolysaccharide export system protein LptC
MTDYYYQDQDADEDAPAGNRPRPSAAEQYPSDRAFFARVEPPPPPGDDDPPVPPEDAWAETNAEPEQLPPDDISPAGDDWDRGFPSRQQQGYPSPEDADYGETEDQYGYPPPADADYGEDGRYLARPAEPASDEAYYYDDEPEPPGLPAPLEAASTAVAGATVARHIRFDPTKERGPSYFERAHRHSRHVRWLKIVLPTIALLGIVGFLALIQVAPNPETAIISLSGINVESKSVTMKKPHISGFEGTRRSYEVNAAQAIQDLNNPKIVTMSKITARLGTGDGGTTHVQAAAGVYDGNTNKLKLSDGITVETSDGYTATLEDADIDIDSGKMTSSKPVEIVTNQVSVKANSIEVQDQGKHIWFRNNVTVVFTPQDAPAGDGAAAKPADGGDTAAGKPSAESGGAVTAKPVAAGAKPADAKPAPQEAATGGSAS